MLLKHSLEQEGASGIDTRPDSHSDPEVPDWATGSRILFQGVFDRHWEHRCLSTLDLVVDVTGLEPFVLLPDDIQLDHYATQYETCYGDAALELLDTLAEGRTSGVDDRFLFIDLEPVMVPLCTEFDLTLHRLLHARIASLPMLGVATSRPECIAATGFDRFAQQPAR